MLPSGSAWQRPSRSQMGGDLTVALGRPSMCPNHFPMLRLFLKEGVCGSDK